MKLNQIFGGAFILIGDIILNYVGLLFIVLFILKLLSIGNVVWFAINPYQISVIMTTVYTFLVSIVLLVTGMIIAQIKG